MKRLWLIIILLLVGCTGVTNQDFLDAAVDCTYLMVDWSVDMDACGYVQGQVHELQQCWNEVPEPPDPNLKQCRREIAEAINWQGSAVRDICNGDRDSASEKLRMSTMLMESATRSLDQYQP